MGTEKFIAFKEDGSAYRLKGRILRFLDNEPVSEADKTNIRSTLSVPASAEGLTPANNLSDLDSAATARTNLSVNSKDEDAQANALKVTAPALYFNGSSSVVTVADDDKLSFTDGVDDLPFSIGFWLKSGTTQTGSIVSKNNSSTVYEWVVQYTSGPYIRIGIFTNGGSSNYIRGYTASTIPSNEWVHVAFTYDGSADATGINAYINGVVSNGLRDEVGTYTGMSNTGAPVWIGRSSTAGYLAAGNQLRQLSIFNRELTASEVAQLARGNDLGFSDEWAGAVGGLGMIDETTGLASWTGSGSLTSNNLTETANTTVGGRANVLKLEATATGAIDTRFYGTGWAVGKRVRVEFDYYLNGGNTTVDTISVIETGGSALNISETTTDAWTRVSVEVVTNGTGTFQFRLRDGGVNNSTAGDYIGLDNFSITEIGCLADFRAEDYNESASKLLDRSSNNFVGVGTSVTLTGNQRHISADTIDLKNLPTSSAGLSAGEVWSNSGVLTVV